MAARISELTVLKEEARDVGEGVGVGGQGRLEQPPKLPCVCVCVCPCCMPGTVLSTLRILTYPVRSTYQPSEASADTVPIAQMTRPRMEEISHLLGPVGPELGFEDRELALEAPL